MEKMNHIFNIVIIFFYFNFYFINFVKNVFKKVTNRTNGLELI